MTDFDSDDPLRKRTRAADPAWRQVPLSDDEVMDRIRAVRASDERIVPGEISAAPSGPSRGWLYVAAAMVLIGGAGYAITSQAGDNSAQDPMVNQPAPPTGGDGGPQGTGVIELQMRAQAPNARCAPTSAEFLRQQDLAFAGTVTEVQGRQVTLTVDEIFKGQPGTEAVVTAAGQQTRRTVYAVDFKAGKSYLVSATDGQVSLCGASDVESKKLRDLYVQAY